MSTCNSVWVGNTRISNEYAHESSWTLVREAEKLVGIKVHQDGVKPASFLEWCSVDIRFREDIKVRKVILMREDYRIWTYLSSIQHKGSMSYKFVAI